MDRQQFLFTAPWNYQYAMNEILKAFEVYKSPMKLNALHLLFIAKFPCSTIKIKLNAIAKTQTKLKSISPLKLNLAIFLEMKTKKRLIKSHL